MNPIKAIILLSGSLLLTITPMQAKTISNDSLDHYNQQWERYQSQKHDTGLIILNRALRYAVEQKSDSAIADFLWKKGYAFQVLNLYDSAAKVFRQSLQIAQQNSYTELEGQAIFRIGNLYHRIGNADSAYFYMSRALEIASANSFKRLEIISLNGLGQYYNRTGLFDEAIAAFTEAYNIADSIKKTSSMSHSLLNLGILYSRTGQQELALEKTRQGIELAKADQNYLRLTELYNNMAILFRKQQAFDSSLFYLRKTQILANTSGIESTQIRTLMNFGTTYAYQKKYQLARIYYDSAWMKAEHTGNVPLKISLLQNLSAVSKDMEDYQASIQYTRKSLQLIQLTKQMNNLPDLYANLYNSWKALDKFDSALYYHEMFKLSSDSLMDQKRIDKLAEVQAKFELNQKEKDLLALKNRSLEQSLEIAASRLRMNILLGGSFTLLIVLMMFWIGYRIKHRKDMIIREREIEKLQKEKEIQASHALIRGQENERKRLAQEIHDGVGVMLSSASMQLSSLTTDVPPAHLKAPLKKAEELIKNAGNSLRQMAQNLIPGVLTKFGLIEALKDFVEEVEESTPISIKLQISGKYTGLSDDKSLMIYRIVQELFNNTIKHAKASLVSLEINFLTEKLFLTYHDNGKGFDAEEIVFESKKPLLWAIDARLAFLHGEMKYVSSPGNGFSCQISVPTNPLPENN